MDTDKIFREILRDIRVELLDEFDKNFERGAFFNGRPWPRSMRPGAKSALIDSGALRRSLRGVTQKDTIEFSSSLPYASIHNCGGTLTVTTRSVKVHPKQTNQKLKLKILNASNAFGFNRKS